jgi:hypothetical protein
MLQHAEIAWQNYFWLDWIADVTIQLWVVTLPSLSSFNDGGGEDDDDDEFDTDIPRSEQPMPREPSIQI